MQQTNMNRLLDPEALPLDDRHKKCTSRTTIWPACGLTRPIERFGARPKCNPICLDCRRFERLFNKVADELEYRNEGLVYFVLDTSMRRDLFRQLSALVKEEYAAAIKEGGHSLAKTLWPKWERSCARYAEHEFAAKKRELGIMPARREARAQRFLYMAAWFDYPKSEIQEGYIFGKSKDVFKRWAGYDFKNTILYLGPLVSWEIGNGASDVEGASKRSGCILKKEIIPYRFDDSLAFMQEYIDASGVDVEPVMYHGQISGREVLPSYIVRGLLQSYRLHERR